MDFATLVNHIEDIPVSPSHHHNVKDTDTSDLVDRAPHDMAPLTTHETNSPPDLEHIAWWLKQPSTNNNESGQHSRSSSNDSLPNPAYGSSDTDVDSNPDSSLKPSKSSNPSNSTTNEIKHIPRRQRANSGPIDWRHFDDMKEFDQLDLLKEQIIRLSENAADSERRRVRDERSSLESMQRVLDRLWILKREKSDLFDWLDKYHERLTQSRNQIDRLNQMNFNQCCEIEQLKSKVNQLETQVTHLEYHKSIKAYDQLRSFYHQKSMELSRKLDESQEENMALSAHIEELNADNSALTISNSAKDTDIKSLRSSIVRPIDKNARTTRHNTKQNSKLEFEISALNQKLSKSQGLSSQVAHLKATNSAVQQKNKTQEKDITALHNALSQQNDKCESLKKSWANVIKLNREMQREHDRDSEEMEEDIRVLEREDEQQNLKTRNLKRDLKSLKGEHEDEIKVLRKQLENAGWAWEWIIWLVVLVCGIAAFSLSGNWIAAQPGWQEYMCNR